MVYLRIYFNVFDPVVALSSLSVRRDCVEQLLYKIQPHKSSGCDNVGNKVVKYYASPLSIPLASIFQKSLNAGNPPTFFLFTRGVLKHQFRISVQFHFCQHCPKFWRKKIDENIVEHISPMVCENQHALSQDGLVKLISLYNAVQCIPGTG